MAKRQPRRTLPAPGEETGDAALANTGSITQLHDNTCEQARMNLAQRRLECTGTLLRG